MDAQDPLTPLPIELQLKVLRRVRWSARSVCQAFRQHIEGGRLALRLKLPQAGVDADAVGGADDAPEPTGPTPTELQALLARLPQLQRLHCSDFSGKTFVPALALPTLRALNLHCFGARTDVSSLHVCTALTSLNLSRCHNLTDLRTLLLACGPCLTQLSVSYTGLSDFTFLTSCPALKSLSLAGCKFDNRGPALQTCRALTSLDLRYCQLSAPHLACLETCTSLTALHLSRNKDLSHLSSLSACPHLVTLEISDCPAILDFSFLVSCPVLQTLTVPGLLPLSAGPLQTCRSLSHLDLRSRPLSDADLASLPALTTLTFLRLSCNPALIQIRCLSVCHQLATLQVSGCTALTSLDGIYACTHLTALDIDRCTHLKSIAPLGMCRSLSTLSLHMGYKSTATTVSDLTPLSACTRLTHLCIGGCPRLTDLQPLAQCTLLRTLNINACRRLCDLRPLAACVSLTNLRLDSCGTLTGAEALAACSALLKLTVCDCSFTMAHGSLPACTRLRFWTRFDMSNGVEDSDYEVQDETDASEEDGGLSDG